LALHQPFHISSRGSIYPYDLCQKTQRSGIQASTAEGTACISPHGHRVRRVKSSPLSLSTPKSRISLPTKRLPVLRLAEQHAGKPRFLELPDKSSTCSVASLAQMAARSALAHGGQRLMRNAALETADLQHCKGLFHHQGHETTANTRQTTVAFDTLDGPYQALYRRHKPTLTR
jgi:hypothetical protein